LGGREDIQGASDKTVVEVHGGQAPSEAFQGEGVDEKVDCMEMGRGARVEMGAQGGRLDARLGRHSGSGTYEFRKGRKWWEDKY
jgi:hypothetical protein